MRGRQRTFTLSIQAEDSGDQPLAGLRIDLRQRGRVVAESKTDPDGEVVFENLAPGSYKIFANGEDTGEEADIERKNEDMLVTYDGDYDPDEPDEESDQTSETRARGRDDEEDEEGDPDVEPLNEDADDDELNFG